jgi:hypothetical protein
MKSLFSFVVVMCIYASTHSQKAKVDTSRNCLQVVNELSYYWKVDSLANNGFRRYTYKKFLNCKPDKLYADVLLNKLGKPNETRKTNKGTEYIYYYFDIRTMPKNYNAPMACWYISFKFENKENYLSSIEEGDIDR